MGIYGWDGWNFLLSNAMQFDKYAESMPIKTLNWCRSHDALMMNPRSCSTVPPSIHASILYRVPLC